MRVVEEVDFGFGKGQAIVKFCLEQSSCACEVRHLKKPISFRLDVGREFSWERRKDVLEYAFDLLLPIVIIDLDPVETGERVAVGLKLPGNLSRERLRHQFCSAEISLVDAEGTSPHGCSACKCDEASEQLSSNLYVNVPEHLLAANQRARMKTDVVVQYEVKGMFEPCDFFVDGDGLVVEHARNDVEAGWADARIKTARFVNEYAQRASVTRHRNSTFKKTGGDRSPPVRWGLPLPVGGSGLRLCQMSDFSDAAAKNLL